MASSRSIAGVVGGIAAVLLFYLVNPWVNPEAGSTISQAVTVGFWISFLVLLVILFQERKQPGGETIDIEGPAFTRFLFGNSKAGLFWLPIRLYLGFSWLEAGYHKFADGGWIDGGSAILAYWERAVAIPEEGRPAISYDWYRAFLQMLIDNGAESWMGWVITFGEMAVGIGLIIGLLTGFAAFFGAFMNMSFLLAGSASTNPVLFTLAIGLMLAWKVAGYYGLDRYVLPMLGTPWRPGAINGNDTRPTA
jgi:thiosulfate dehydrogenase [quinone] large subunit